MFGHGTYLIFELAWALPVIAGQWLAGRRILARRLRMLLIGTLCPTAYFAAADAVAIHAGIWTLNPARIVGLRLGPLPLEEAVFFLVTNLMVVQGWLLFGAEDAPVDLCRFVARADRRGRAARR